VRIKLKVLVQGKDKNTRTSLPLGTLKRWQRHSKRHDFGYVAVPVVGAAGPLRLQVLHDEKQNVRVVAGRSSRRDEVVQAIAGALGFWRVRGCLPRDYIKYKIYDGV